MKKLLIFVLIPILLFTLTHIEVEATNGLPYATYTYSSAIRRLVWTQDAYLPLSERDNLDGLSLDQPQDLTIDADDNVYVADYGNSRVIKYSLQDNQSEIIGEGILDKPMGVHVDESGNVYVADYGLKQGLKFTYSETSGMDELI